MLEFFLECKNAGIHLLSGTLSFSSEVDFFVVVYCGNTALRCSRHLTEVSQTRALVVLADAAELGGVLVADVG